MSDHQTTPDNPPTSQEEADNHVCKPGATTYYCPTAGEVESDCHGGFDTCCAAPRLHMPINDSDLLAEVERLATELHRSEDARAWVREQCAIRERSQKASPGQGEVQTGDVLAWLEGPKCSRQLDRTEGQTDLAADIECAIGLNTGSGGAEGVYAARDAVLAVRDQEVEQLRARLSRVQAIADRLASQGRLGVDLEADGIRRGIAQQLHDALGTQVG